MPVHSGDLRLSTLTESARTPATAPPGATWIQPLMVSDPAPGDPKPGGRQPEADRGGAEVLMASGPMACPDAGSDTHVAGYPQQGTTRRKLLIAGIIFAGTYLHNIPPSLRLVGGIAWLAGALGISLKGIGVLLGTGLKEVEGWLWNIELDG